jgi:DNA modification methylase
MAVIIDTMERTRSRQTPSDWLREAGQSGEQRDRARFRGDRNERKIEWVSVASLRPHPSNARTHSRAQIRQIAKSIEKFGWTVPILVDQNGRVVAGHARLEAAILLGLERVPIIRLEHLTEAQTRAYIIADNKLAENAGWDRELLAIELKQLVELDLDFDVTITGFETAEIDLLLQGAEPSGAGGAEDEIPELEPPVSQLGDLWILGKHRLLCADATNARSFKRLLGGMKAQLVFIDPPYNVPIDGHVSGLGAVKHREFAMAAGEMSSAEFAEFLKTIFAKLVTHSADGSMHFVCMDWRHIYELLTASNSTYHEVKNVCVWVKSSSGMGSLYRSQHELVFVFKNGSAAHINNVELGRFGRNRTNVWQYAGANTFREGRLEELAMHPTVKPVALVSDAILDCSKRGGIVLDCFGGSGTTLIAAEKAGRRGYLMELDPAYVDVTIARFRKLTGADAIHAETGLTFAETQRERAADSLPSEPVE